MNVKACAFLLLGLGGIAAIVDASTKEVTTSRPTPVVTKKVVKNNYRSTSGSSTRYGDVEKVETYNPYVQPTMPNEVEPFDLPPHFPPPMFPEKRRSPCGPGGCPRR